jgi:hypothetical protein
MMVLGVVGIIERVVAAWGRSKQDPGLHARAFAMPEGAPPGHPSFLFELVALVVAGRWGMMGGHWSGHRPTPTGICTTRGPLHACAGLDAPAPRPGKRPRQ